MNILLKLKKIINYLDKEWNISDKFWSHFGGIKNVEKIKDAKAAGDDEDYWRDHRENVSLWKWVIGKLKNLIEKLVKISENIFRVSDASGKLEITKKSQGGLNTADLDSKDAFIVDAVSGGLFVWIGKECTMNERKKAMEWGQEYLKKQASKIKINFSNF